MTQLLKYFSDNKEVRTRTISFRFSSALACMISLALAACQTAKPRPDSPPPSKPAASFGPPPSKMEAGPDFRKVYRIGKNALQQKDGPTAVNQFSQCVSEDPESAECHWELGWAHFLEQDFEKAKAALETVSHLKPDKPGLSTLLKRVNDHLALRLQTLVSRSSALPSFNPRRKKKQTTVTIRAVGDTMLGTDFPSPMLPPEGSSPLGLIQDLLQGSDITFANYEGTFCDGETSVKCAEANGPCFSFRTPTRNASQLKEAGFDVVSLANNHIMDFGGVCRKTTEKTLDDLGILWSGRPGTVARFTRKSVKYSMIAFHSAPHTNSTLDFAAARNLIRAEKKQGRVVIVSFHGGAEGFDSLHTPKSEEIYLGESRGAVVQFAHRAVDAGADLVLGSGPHVVRGMEFYRRKLIAYSLGNFSTYKAFNIWGFNGVGLILEVQLNPQGNFVSGRIIPTRQQGFGLATYDPKMTATDLIRFLSQRDFPRGGAVIARDGTIGTRGEVAVKLAAKKATKKVRSPVLIDGHPKGKAR